MTVVKKTVALDPIIDRYVRMLQAVLIEKGYGVSYSATLNYMLLYSALDLAHREIHPKVARLQDEFLSGRKTIGEIEREWAGSRESRGRREASQPQNQTDQEMCPS